MKQYLIIRNPSNSLQLPNSCKEGAIVKLPPNEAEKAILAGVATEVPEKLETDVKQTIETKSSETGKGK